MSLLNIQLKEKFSLCYDFLCWSVNYQTSLHTTDYLKFWHFLESLIREGNITQKCGRVWLGLPWYLHTGHKVNYISSENWQTQFCVDGSDCLKHRDEIWPWSLQPQIINQLIWIGRQSIVDASAQATPHFFTPHFPLYFFPLIAFTCNVVIIAFLICSLLLSCCFIAVVGVKCGLWFQQWNDRSSLYLVITP